MLLREILVGLPGDPVVKISPSSAGDVGSIPEWGTKIPLALTPKHKTSNVVINSIDFINGQHKKNLKKKDKFCQLLLHS